MRIIGDVHGHFERYLDKIRDYKGKTFQVGDMGLGFPNGGELPELSPNNFFIRGNHDNPSVCRKHPNYVGEFGYWKDEKLFFMGGAWSIDYAWRQVNQMKTGQITWWRDEELFQPELDEAFRVYKMRDPKLVITHDCPTSIGELILEKTTVTPGGSEKKFKTRTAETLERMFQFHQPEIWVFGHWHFDLDFVVNGTRFICLAELSFIDL